MMYIPVVFIRLSWGWAAIVFASDMGCCGDSAVSPSFLRAMGETNE